MVMNITAFKGIDSTNYETINDTKKVATNNENSSSTKNQEVSQYLGNDIFVKSTEDDTANSTYKPKKKKLNTEEINSLKQDQENIKSDLINKFISDTINNQNKLLGRATDNGTNEISQGSKDLLTKIFGSLENAYPEVAATPEGAQKAISEGGAYSVDAVSDRIMTMATAIAGDNPDKLQKMRDAVEKGFEKAGLDFKSTTKSDLPQICQDTITEVMNRFDKLQNKTNIYNNK